MTATHAVVFECKHRAVLLDEEHGDGSAWCQQCGAFRCYDAQPEACKHAPSVDSVYCRFCGAHPNWWHLSGVSA